MSVRSQAQATSTMSAVVTLILTNAFHQGAILHTHPTIDRILLIQSKPKNKKQNQLQETEKDKTQKD